MADEFEGVDRLKRLKDDAKLAAAAIEAAAQDGSAAATTIVEISRQRSPRAPKSEATSDSPQQPAAPPVSLSTLVFAATKKRLARAAHLQAASDQHPNTQWEIVDRAINEWCDKNGY